MPRVLRFFQRGLWEKTRVALAVGLVVFAATAVYTLTRPKIYEATASVSQWVPQHVLKADAGQILGEAGRCGDMALARRIAENSLILKRVADRLTPDDRHSIVSTPTDDPLDSLAAKRSVQTNALGCLLSFTIRDSDRFRAARIANLFAAELAAFESRYTHCREPSIEQVDSRLERFGTQVAALEAQLATATEQERPALLRALEINRYHLTAIRLQKETMLNAQNPREAAQPRTVLATPPAADDYVSPHIPLHLGAGLLASLTLGTLASATAARRQSTTRSPTGLKQSGSGTVES